MSHFTVMVALPGGTALDTVEDQLHTVLAPWDEKVSVDPYRVYEECAPSDYWWVRSVRRDVDHLANGTGLKEYDPNLLGWSSRSTKETPEQQREEFARNAEWAKRLGDNPTWKHVVELYRERFPADGNEEQLHHDAESDRAYTMSTYNPDSKWDYFRLGGRSAGRFLAKSADANVIKARRDWDSPAGATDPLRCNGGVIGDLDLDGMRDAAEVKAFGEYRTWETLLEQAQQPTLRSWADFYASVKVGDLTIDQAREQYRTQPIIKATQGKEDALGVDLLDCPIAHFALPRAEYVAAARTAAISGYALVTLDREWIAPGRMGMFGCSTDSADEMLAYRAAADKYISSLSEDTVLVIVDCHI